MNTSGTIFNNSRVRLGKLQLTRLGFLRMSQYKLTTDVLEETFRYGREVEPHVIVEEYHGYEVGMICTVDEVQVFRGNLDEVRVLIVTCWKRFHR